MPNLPKFPYPGIPENQTWTIKWDQFAWFAEGHPLDICASAPDLPTLGGIIDVTVRAELELLEELGGEIPKRGDRRKPPQP